MATTSFFIGVTCEGDDHESRPCVPVSSLCRANEVPNTEFLFSECNVFQMVLEEKHFLRSEIIKKVLYNQVHSLPHGELSKCPVTHTRVQD